VRALREDLMALVDRFLPLALGDAGEPGLTDGSAEESEPPTG